MRIALSAAAIFFALSSQTAATTVVAVWTPTTTALGADSLTHTLDENKYWSICKIRSVNNVFWAGSGVTANPYLHFSLEDTVSAAMSSHASLDEKISAFETKLLPALSEVIHLIRQDDPSWYSQHAEGLPVLRILFDEFEGGMNRLRLREFVAKSAAIGDEVDILVRRTDCPGPDCAAFRVFLLGQFDFAGRVAGDAEMWKTAGLSEGVRRAIAAEIAANPGHVGPPISIVEISKDGPNWVEKGQCGPDENK